MGISVSSLVHGNELIIEQKSREELALRMKETTSQVIHGKSEPLPRPQQ